MCYDFVHTYFMQFHNTALRALIANQRNRLPDLAAIEATLRDHGTLTFVRLRSGLFPASPSGIALPESGYANVWVRDNVYVAHAHAEAGETAVAGEVARALLEFFSASQDRFRDVISGRTDPADISRRPHVRFDGERMEEIRHERWPHAQNDALGYFLWLYARLAGTGDVPLDTNAVTLLALFPSYFRAIRYWEDEDSGHWEETRKVSASSIGTVIAGLEELFALSRSSGAWAADPSFADDILELLALGRSALASILPGECAQLAPQKNRRYDAALLFLIYPLEIVDGEMADLIIHDIERFLAGRVGIRRYLGDSYWAPDYDKHLRVPERTRNFADDVDVRDRLLEVVGEEAEWCIFDPILSVVYGRRFLVTRSPTDRDRQLHHFNRTLSQITPSWECPELYYHRDGQLRVGPHTPLQWTQANLLLALKSMARSLESDAHPHEESSHVL
ncbi:MAG TPA: glycoside hydrolase family 15 protein [Thermoanaerobaculia bacterium]|nr:glycoside hydrolase family 15 protein [Thermoanaerobaculia bacterium]